MSQFPCRDACLRPTLLALAIAFASASEVEAIDFAVGVGPGCFSPDIQVALDAAKLSPGEDRVAITNSTPASELTVLALQINNDDVLLSGGWTDCMLSAQGARTVLSGSGGTDAPVLHILGAVDVAIQSVELIEGDAEEGAGLYFNGSGSVRLSEMVVRNNRATQGGGGISVRGPAMPTGAIAVLQMDADVSVEDNSAQYGGGLLVRDASVRIVGPELRLVRNRADVGAGIHLDGAAEAQIASDGGSGGAVLADNVASQRGGAIVAFGDAVVKLYTRGGKPTTLAANSAGNGGSAIHASFDSEITAWDVIVVDHRVPVANEEQGGTLELSGRARVAFVRDLTAQGGAPPGAVNCTLEQRCNRLEGNHTGQAPTWGGAALAYLYTGGTLVEPRLTLDGATVHGNAGGGLVLTDGYGSPTPLLGTIALRNSLIVGNETFDGLFASFLPLNVEHLTVVDNLYANNPYVFRVVGDLRLHRSLVQEGANVVTFYRGQQPAAAQFDIQHTLFHADPGIANPPPTLHVGDAGFADRAGGDFHLRANSIALDAAPADAAIPRDADLNQRAIDQPTVMDIAGIADLGAYERPYDDIFANGFEGAP